MDVSINFKNDPFYTHYLRLRKRKVSGLSAIMDYAHSLSEKTVDNVNINEYFISVLLFEYDYLVPQSLFIKE